MNLQKVISKITLIIFVDVLKVTYERSGSVSQRYGLRIRIKYITDPEH
jgi:hypothetical protein